MQIRLLSILVSLSIVSCSDSTEEGFIGEWEGKSLVILNGNPVESDTEATVYDSDNLTRECEVTVNGLTYQFDATDEIDILTYIKAPAKNLSDSLYQTFITGTAELIGDSLLTFIHQVVTMDGSAVVSAIDYNLEFKRKE